MGTFQEFERDLRDALSHLYDPAYRPSELLCQVVGCDRSQGLGSVPAMLRRAIEALKPAPETPPSTRVRRIYHVLYYRYVEHLGQEETAEHLGITPRHLRREQQDAIRMLAESLWRQQYGQVPPAGELDQAEGVPVPGPESEPPEWRSQVRLEFSALRKSGPDSVADVGEDRKSVV